MLGQAGYSFFLLFWLSQVNSFPLSFFGFLRSNLFPFWAPSDLFCALSFPSYGRFCEGTRSTRKKSSSTPLWGHRLPVTASVLSARGMDKMLAVQCSQTV